MGGWRGGGGVAVAEFGEEEGTVNTAALIARAVPADENGWGEDRLGCYFSRWVYSVRSRNGANFRFGVGVVMG